MKLQNFLATMLIVGFGAVFLNYKIYEQRTASTAEVEELRKENQRLSQLLRSQSSLMNDHATSSVQEKVECDRYGTSIENQEKEIAFRKTLEDYTQLHKDIVGGKLPMRLARCVIINGWGNVFQEAVSCFIFALVTRRAIIFDIRNIEWYMPFKDYIPPELMPFEGYRYDLLEKYPDYVIPRFNLTCLDYNIVADKELITIHLTYDWFAPNILINPYFGEQFVEKLPPNYFEIIFGYLYKLRPDLLEEIMQFKKQYFGKFTIGIQIRHPTKNQKGEKDHKGFPVPPLDLYAQTAEQLSRFQTKVPYDEVVWFVATQNLELITKLQNEYGQKKIVWFNRTITTTFDIHPEGQRVSIQTWWLMGECNEVISTEASSYGITAAVRTGMFPIICNHHKFCFRKLSQTPCQDTPFLPEQPEDCLVKTRKRLHQFLTSPENSCGYFKYQIYWSEEYREDKWEIKAIQFVVSKEKISAILALDLGADSIKIATYTRIGESKPFVKVIFNEQGKRKLSNQIGFDNQGLRLFGDDANSLSTRFPNRVVRVFTHMVGIDNLKVVSEIQNKFPAQTGYRNIPFTNNTERHVIGYEIPVGEETSIFTPEELTAHFIRHTAQVATHCLNENTENELQVSYRTVVLSVPPYFTTHQRECLLAAMQMAGINVSTTNIVDDYVAASHAFAIDRGLDVLGDIADNSFATIAFFDIGAGSTRASLISYERSSIGIEKGKVLNVVWDYQLSGNSIDQRLVSHFLSKLTPEQQTLAEKRPKSIEKLFREVRRVKEMLSANKDASIKVDNFLDDFDLQFSITRSEFERVCSDLFNRLSDITKSLLSYKENEEIKNIEVGEIYEVELIGGTSRIPAIQQTIREVFQKPEIGFHLNADESVVIGAIYYGVSSRFSLEYPIPIPIEIILIQGKEGAAIFSGLTKQGDFSLVVSIPNKNLDEYIIEIFYQEEKTFNQVAKGNQFNIASYALKVNDDLGNAKDVELELSFKITLVNIELKVATIRNTDLDVKNNLAIIRKDVPRYPKQNEILGGISRLHQFEKKEALQREKLEAKSNLESLVFSIKEKLESGFIKDHSTSKEREQIQDQVDEISRKMEENQDLEKDEYFKLYYQLKNSTSTVLGRYEDLSKLETTIGESQNFIRQMKSRVKLAKSAGIPTKDVEEMIKELGELLESSNDKISKGISFNAREMMEQILKKRLQADIVLKQLDKAKKAKTDKGQDSVKYTVLGIVALILLGGLGFIFAIRYKDIQFPGKGHKLGAKKEKKERLKEMKKRS